MDYYKHIFKRKSFHLFRDAGVITDQDIRELEEFIGSVKPLYAEIKTEVRIVPEMRQPVNGVDSFAFYFTAKAKKDICGTLDILGNRLICTLHQRISVLCGLE